MAAPVPADFEKLGVFYLGRRYDNARGALTDELTLYPSKDLVTHGVIVGMTGSGKTGLGITLLEEAAIDGIPAIVIDPKGDLGNLFLTFPDLAPSDFAPWVPRDEAQRAGMSVEQYAASVAEKWKQGLGEWGEDGERIRRMKSAVDFALYTPGGTAGRPISVLQSFSPPSDALLSDAELFRQRVATTVSSVLSLAGVDADPVKSREHILLSQLLSLAWQKKQALDLAGLIQQVQTPPIQKIGVLDLDAFFPAKERFELVLALNNLLAAPGFQAWMEGEPLDVQSLLFTREGKPRLSLISLSHLGDSERMFFVSLLLSQIVSWMRAQPGTQSLRALVYMDELFGFFPPVANPPSKQPLLTLLKQARAFGVGVTLATQNPVDLDYKGLANAGTWFLGRLQTERDKARVLDGLEGASASTGTAFDRAKMDALLSGLAQRTFLLHDVHAAGPQLFQSRWTLSYLRGPMGRDELKLLSAQSSTQLQAVHAEEAPATTPPAPSAPANQSRPTLPSEIIQVYAPNSAGKTLKPMLLGASSMAFVDNKLKVNVTSDDVFVTPFSHEGVIAADWKDAKGAGCTLDELTRTPPEGASYLPLPSDAANPKKYAAWQKELAQWLMTTHELVLWKSPSFGAVSQPGEAEGDFRARLQLLAREEKDAAAEKLRKKYEPKFLQLQEKIRKAQDTVAREQSEADAAKRDSYLQVGSSVMGAIFGRGLLSSANLGRASSAARGMSRQAKQAQDVERAQTHLDALKTQLSELDAQFRSELNDAASGAEVLNEPLEKVVIRATRPRTTVKLVALAWFPTDS